MNTFPSCKIVIVSPYKVAKEKFGKYVVFVSDGRNSKCISPWYKWFYDDCKGVIADSSGNYEKDMANELWTAGYELVYVMVGNYYLENEKVYEKVEKVTRGFSNFIRVPRYDMIDASVTEAVLNVICKNV